jgi:hypothetical protein
MITGDTKPTDSCLAVVRGFVLDCFESDLTILG